MSYDEHLLQFHSLSMHYYKETCRVPVLFKNAPDIHTRAFINIFSMNYLCILFFNKDRKFVFAAGMALKCSLYLNIF